MALRRWRWAWGPVLAAVALAVLLLPGGQLSQAGALSWLFGPQTGLGRAASYRRDVETALRVQRARLRLAERADSIVIVAHGPRALRAPDGGVVVVYETPLTAGNARAWLDAAGVELTRYPGPASPGMPVVIALYSNPARAKDLEFGNYAWATRRLMPDSARAACIVEVNLVPWGRNSTVVRRPIRPSRRPEAPFLDVCGLYRRFGAPGRDIARWIRVGLQGGGDLARIWSIALAQARRSVPRREMTRPSLAEWREWPWYWGTPWVPIACLRGARSLCERNMRIRGSSGIWYYSDARGAQFVAFLLASGTPAQFAVFWRSPLAMADALQRAYGRPAGQLAYEAYTHWYYAAPGGPRAESRLLLAGLFWAGAALALAVVAGRRWKTEI